MKKILLALLSVVILGSGAMAQDNSKASRVKADKTKTNTNAQSTPVQNSPNEQARLKKDGTPDKRYKANKASETPQPSGPVKKDGTPDMRHKANKAAAADKN